MPADLLARYVKEGRSLGLTIAEWEAKEGLPLFSVWPEAESAKEPMDPGRFIYCSATAEEREQLVNNRHRGFHGLTIRKQLSKKKKP